MPDVQGGCRREGHEFVFLRKLGREPCRSPRLVMASGWQSCEVLQVDVSRMAEVERWPILMSKGVKSEDCHYLCESGPVCWERVQRDPRLLVSKRIHVS